jgi:hypothetical protein
MPSPIGHALAGAAVGWLVHPAVTGDRRAAFVHVAAFAAAGAAADLDLLVDAHSGASHGLGAAALAGLVVWGGRRALARSRRGRQGAAGADPGRWGLAVGLAYASHTLLDWLGSDTSPPIGIMALWPLRLDYYEAGLHVFEAISRRYAAPDFWSGNLRALARELAILLPIAIVVGLARRRPAPTDV